MNIGLLFQMQKAKLHKFSVSILNNSELADEVLQDVHASVLRLKVEPKNPSGYLMTAVYHKSLNKLRSPSLSTKFVEVEALNDYESDLDSPEAGSIKSDNIAELREAVAKLGPAQREIIEAYLAGYTPYEYARNTGTNKFTAKANFRHGVQKLRTLLGA